MNMDVYDDYLDCSDDDLEFANCSSYLISSDSEKDDLDEEIFNSKSAAIAESEDDEFERDMAEELSITMNNLTASLLQGSSGKKPTKKKTVTFAEKDKTEPKFYDDIYFDSDSSTDAEMESKPSTKFKARTKHEIISNDELFYDPDMDDEDQAWVDNKRKSYQVKRKKKNALDKDKVSTKLSESDAVLNCPACLTTLCLDSQRHEIYNNQYRAMFVFHCKTDFTEKLRFPEKNKNNYMKTKKLRAKQKKKTKVNMEISTQKHLNLNLEQDGCCNKTEDANSNKDDDLTFSAMDTEKVDLNAVTKTDEEYYHPVSCDVCNTKVAVFDKDEVYHFFNVVTSY